MARFWSPQRSYGSLLAESVRSSLEAPSRPRNTTRGSRRRLWAGSALVTLVALAGCEATDTLELARIAVDERDRVRALALYQRHLDTNSNDFDARLEYTLLLGEHWAFKGGDRGPILENLELLYEDQPDNEKIRGFYSTMLIREGQADVEAQRYEDAERTYDLAIDVHPDVGTAHYWQAVLNADNLRRPDVAFEHLVAAAAKRPPIPDLYLRLGDAYLERGDVDRSINTLELVERLSGTSTYLIPRMHCSLARAFRRRGDPSAARMHAELASDDCAEQTAS